MPRHANLAAIWDVATVDTGEGQALAVSLVGGGAGGASNVAITSGPTGANALQVQGTTAPLAAALGYPVQVGGVNDGSVRRAALIDTSVNGEGAFVVAALGSDGEGVAFPMSGGRLLVSNTAEPTSLGQKTGANSFPVVMASDTLGPVKLPGAPNFVSGQVTASTSAGTLVAARATRRNVSIVNMDSTITVYVGPATVTTGNGYRLLAGQSVVIDSTVLIQVIAASGSPVVGYAEVYD